MTLYGLLRIGGDAKTSAEGWGLKDESAEGGEWVSADSDWEEELLQNYIEKVKWFLN